MPKWFENIITKWASLIAKYARPGGDNAHAIYVHLARAARRDGFYLRFDIADTLDGRFDVLTLLTVLVIRRLHKIKNKGRGLGQDVVDIMFADMDLSMHEIGVSENKVSKKVKLMATAFLGRQSAYINAIDANDRQGLSDALARNLYRGNGTDPLANGLVAAVFMEAARLDGLYDDDLLMGKIGEMKGLEG